MESGEIKIYEISWKWFVINVNDCPSGKICSKSVHYYDISNNKNNMWIDIPVQTEELNDRAALLLLPYIRSRLIENENGDQIELILTPRPPKIESIKIDTLERPASSGGRLIVHSFIPPTLRCFPSVKFIGEMNHRELLQIVYTHTNDS